MYLSKCRDVCKHMPYRPGPRVETFRGWQMLTIFFTELQKVFSFDEIKFLKIFLLFLTNKKVRLQVAVNTRIEGFIICECFYLPTICLLK